MGHLYHILSPKLLDHCGRARRKILRRPEQNNLFCTRKDHCFYEIKAAAAACIRTNQSTFQHGGMDGGAHENPPIAT